MNYPLRTLKRIRDPHTLAALQLIKSVDAGGERTVGDRAVLILIQALKGSTNNPSKQVLDVTIDDQLTPTY